MPKQYVEVGRVVGIYRYPVKSFAGECIQETRAGWHGINADRRYAFLKLDSKRGFPWLTIRDCPQLAQFKAYLLNPDDPMRSPIHVITPEGDDLPLLCSDLQVRVAELSRSPVHLINNWSGVFDAMDVSILSTNSLCQLGQQMGQELDVNNFRPNIVVEIFDQRPFPEDRWLKELLVFGDRNDSARIRVNRKTQRCMVANVDPLTGRQNPAILKSLVQTRKNQLGVYGTVEHPGSISVGDVIRMVKD